MLIYADTYWRLHKPTHHSNHTALQFYTQIPQGGPGASHSKFIFKTGVTIEIPLLFGLGRREDTYLCTQVLPDQWYPLTSSFILLYAFPGLNFYLQIPNSYLQSSWHLTCDFNIYTSSDSALDVESFSWHFHVSCQHIPVICAQSLFFRNPEQSILTSISNSLKVIVCCTILLVFIL